MNQNITVRKVKLYCKYCKGTPTVEIPHDFDLSLDSSSNFLENVRCTICKNIGYVKR